MYRICFSDSDTKFKYIENDGEIGDCLIIYSGSEDGFSIRDGKDVIIDVDKINGFAIQANDIKVIDKIIKEFEKIQNKIKERD